MAKSTAICAWQTSFNKDALRKAIKWSAGWRVGTTMHWGMTLLGRDAAYLVRIPAKDGKHRYKYRVSFYDYVTTDIVADKTFYSLNAAKKYAEHYVGA